MERLRRKFSFHDSKAKTPQISEPIALSVTPQYNFLFESVPSSTFKQDNASVDSAVRNGKKVPRSRHPLNFESPRDDRRHAIYFPLEAGTVKHIGSKHVTATNHSAEFPYSPSLSQQPSKNASSSNIHTTTQEKHNFTDPISSSSNHKRRKVGNAKCSGENTEGKERAKRTQFQKHRGVTWEMLN